MMSRISIVFLQVVVVLIGIGTLALLLWEPQVEGCNVGATNFEIYFKDPFLAYAYIGSISFFVILYQVFRLLGNIGKNRIFSLNSVKSLRIIKYCSGILIAFIAGAEAFIVIIQRSKSDDIAGGVAMGLMLMFISVVIGTAAAVLEKILQKAVDMKSENDLTI